MISEHQILIFLIQIFLLLLIARGLGERFRVWRQPTLTAEILTGIILGPTLFGRLFPNIYSQIFPSDPVQSVMLETVVWLGGFFLLLEAGLEIDLPTVWRQKGDAVKIAVIGIVLPIILSFFCLWFFLPVKYLMDPRQKTLFLFFLAVLISITAMPMVTRILRDVRLSKTDLGFLIMSALSINDIIGWLVLTFVLLLFFSGAAVIAKISTLLAATVAFGVLSLTVGRWVIDKAIMKIKEKQLPEPSTSMAVIFIAGLLCGAITQYIGINALLGFFVAGIMAGGAKGLSERTRQGISQMVYAVFVPLFFVNVGLRVDFLKNFDLGLVVFITVLGIGAKFLGAWIGAKTTKAAPQDQLTIAIAHTPGGLMEIVVGMLALQKNLMSEEVFVALVCEGVLSSLLIGPWLNFSLDRRKQVRAIEYFSRSGISADIHSTQRDHAIVEMCELTQRQSNMPLAEDIAEQVLKRENAMGTAIEEGVAVPHARLLTLTRPVVLFGRSKRGIDWNSPDGKLTHFIFLILTPHQAHDVQVQILRSVAAVMGDVHIGERILAARNAEEAWGILEQAFTSRSIIRNGG